MSLNLENFEGDIAKDTPYILTSPRSLRACSTLRIQPNELLYRGLEEYEETFCDLPLSEIYRLYEEQETLRQEKLLRCRKERQRLIQGKMSIALPPGNYAAADNNNDNSSDDDDESNINFSETRVRSMEEKRQTGPVLSRMKRYTSAPAVNKPVGKSTTKGPSVNFEKNSMSTTDLKSSRTNNCWNSSRCSSSASKRVVLQASDTESAADEQRMLAKNTNLTVNRSRGNSRSVPDLSSKSNLNFRKYSSSPRHHCPCSWDIRDQDVLSEYMSQYGDILDSPDLSLEDRKIMECLILKRGKEMEFEKKSQEMRKLIEQDRIRRWTENQQVMQCWQERLAEKRRFENMVNTKRYLELQSRWQNDRTNLMKHLEERDKRIQHYLDDLNYKRKRSMLEKQRREALRQLEVGKAIEKIVEEDKQHRNMMREKLQRRMEEADSRKRRRERDYYRHISEMNRMEEIKRSLRLERLEQEARQSVEELKGQIEEKENRAQMNYLRRLSSRNRALSEGSGSRQKALEKAQNIHAQLLKGLEEWHQKLAEFQVEAQRRAEMKYKQEINRRRVRVASERLLREERSHEMLKRVHEMEAQRKDLLKAIIESKEHKSARLQADKERKVQISRIKAQHAAELRQQLKEQIHPETFDKMAARADMELKIMKRKPKCSASGGGGGSNLFHCGGGKSATAKISFATGKRCSSCFAGRRSSVNHHYHPRSYHYHHHHHRQHSSACHSNSKGSGGGSVSAFKSSFGGPVKPKICASASKI